MAFQIEQGIVRPALWCPSPNCSARPIGQDISLLVIHNISLPPGEFGGGFVDAFFQNKLDPSRHPYFATIANLQVSAHCFIDRAGGVTQYVNLADRAWHAGVSQFEGRENCNDFSIGIELEGTDDLPYCSRQYDALVGLTAAIMAVYPISRQRIVGHCTIAPGRKSDPGPAFDWTDFQRRLTACPPHKP